MSAPFRRKPIRIAAVVGTGGWGVWVHGVRFWASPYLAHVGKVNVFLPQEIPYVLEKAVTEQKRQAMVE